MALQCPSESWVAESSVEGNIRSRDEVLSYMHDVVEPPASKQLSPPRCAPQARSLLGLLGLTLIVGRGTASSRQSWIVVHNPSDDADWFEDHDTCAIKVWYYQYTRSLSLAQNAAHQ
jgi:hypothetical protein